MPRAKNPPHAHELKRADNLTENAHASKHAHTRAHTQTQPTKSCAANINFPLPARAAPHRITRS